MGFTLGLLLAIQVQTGGGRGRGAAIVRDSDVVDSLPARGRHAHVARRRAVTAEVLRTAFADERARALFDGARAARLRQDSALVAYDAMSYQRISAGMGFARIGRDRLLFRSENASEVHWRRDLGAWIEVKGARHFLPQGMDDDDSDPDMSGEASAVPYYPGYEPIWIGGGDVAKAQVDETEIVHPLADGAEAYYTYEVGDSLSFTLPDKRVVRLRELRVRPRAPAWNVVVGSFWLDAASSQLVRAAYRLSIPMDIWYVARQDDPHAMDDIPKWVKPLLTPMKAEVKGIAIEYGLYGGRFWLPRTRAADGSAQVSFMRVPFQMEQRFTYSGVNGADTLPTLATTLLVQRRDQMRRDSIQRAHHDALDSAGRAADDAHRDSLRIARRDSMRAVRRARQDSVRLGLRPRDPMPKAACDTSDARISDNVWMAESKLAVVTRIPCDTAALAHSPDLPPSIFDKGEEVFGTKEREALIAEALAMGAQPPLAFGHLPPPSLHYGLDLMRFNRVEAVSAGATVEQQVGGGYAVQALARIGTTRLEPNAELSVSRTNLSRTVTLSGYSHLVSAGDWGHPLSFGSSLSALLFGRDEGFYYYATGADITGNTEPMFGGAQTDWRLFAERQRTAPVGIHQGITGGAYAPDIVATARWYEGASVRARGSYGSDPNGFRLLSDLRLEGGVGDSAYARAALDLTPSRAFGSFAASVTLSGGSSVGALPPQRRWFLGGLETVRGQSPDTAQSGNAFWFTRTELGTSYWTVRPAIFADVGWVGDRARVAQVGRPLSGVGSGVSFLDGLFRFDLARGLYPRRQWRADLSVESRF